MTPSTTPRRRSRLLVLARDLPLLAALDEAVGAECSLELEPEPDAALERLSERPYVGAVIDAQLAGPYLHAVCSGYLERQPIGRVVIVSAEDDPATLMRLAVRDSRVEVLFAPVLPATFSETLFGTNVDEEVGERTHGRRTMRWLLARP